MLWVLTYEILDDSPEANVQFIFSKIREFYKEHSYGQRKYSTFKVLKLHMFTQAASPNAKYPELKGKANMIRRVLPALLAVYEEYYPAAICDDDSRLDRWVSICPWATCVSMQFIKYTVVHTP